MSRISLKEPYEPRPVRFLRRVEHNGWQLKLYGIAYENDQPDTRLVETAMDQLFERLPTPAIDEDRYGVGFMIVHEGRDGNFGILCWWTNENELEHRLVVSPADAPTQLEYRPDGPVGCVWDIAVISYERDAWVETILANPDGPSVEAYLKRRLTTDI